VARTSEVLRAHRPSTTITGHCLCGFKVPAWETIEEHRARMICAELFHMKPRDARDPGLTAPHPGGADNLATHRALGEAPCIGCLRYLDDVMSEGQGVRARV
jgi:hypothetical protein